MKKQCRDIFGVEKAFGKFYITKRKEGNNRKIMSIDIAFDKISHARKFAKFYNFKIEEIEK